MSQMVVSSFEKLKYLHSSCYVIIVYYSSKRENSNVKCSNVISFKDIQKEEFGFTPLYGKHGPAEVPLSKTLNSTCSKSGERFPVKYGGGQLGLFHF